jgi:hypothetical protein
MDPFHECSFSSVLCLLTALTAPWIEEDMAKFFLRTRRQGRRPSGGSITSECCTRVGCNWEEYAEYCPSNKRVTRFTNNLNK